MNAIKGGWVGQTFALAKSNDTGGKKLRIRRTKEERKAMVESFIKKFQKSNDGNFPSLNLTHKEVGGSFYIVREIVREIIQENRVLGPAKLTPEELKNVGLLEQYPLGTISTAPESHLLISNGTEVVLSNHSRATSGEQDMVNLNEHFSDPGYQKSASGKIADGIIEEVGNDVVFDGPIITHVSPRDYQATSYEEDIELEEEFGKPGSHKIDNGLVVNGISQVVEESKASDLPISIHVASLDERATSDRKDIDSGEELGRPEIHGVDNVLVVNESNLAVEKSRVSDELLYTESEVREALDVDVSEAKQVNMESTRRAHMTGDVMVETFPLRPVPKAINVLDTDSAEQGKYSGTSKENETEKVEVEAGKNSSVESSSSSTEEKVNPNQKSLLSDGDIRLVDEKAAVSIVYSTVESLNLSSSTKSLDLAVKDSASNEVKSTGVPNGLHAETVKDTNSSGIHGPPISEEAVAIKNKSVLNTDSSHKGSEKTLDRIYLESWERTSEKSARPETNSLLALLKAFISSFVKFWAE